MADMKLGRNEPFLNSLENPKDPNMKKVYEEMHQRFGKVITPTRVFYARLPWEVYANFYAQISQLDKKLSLNPLDDHASPPESSQPEFLRFLH